MLSNFFKQSKYLLHIFIFILCSSFTTWQTIKCIEKYVADPHATLLELTNIYESTLPEISFCIDRLESFNESILEECDIDHYLSGPWSSEQCPNPKELRDKLGIRSDQIIKLATALSTEKLKTKVLAQNEWKYLRPWCITLDLKVMKNDEKVAYNILTFKLNLNATVYFHTKGKFTDTYKGLEINTKTLTELDFDYEVVKLLNTEHATCNDDEDYNKDECVLQEMYNTSMDTIGCTTPLGHNHDHICTTPDEAQNASKIYVDILVLNNYNCKEPCNTILTHYSIIRKETTLKNLSELKINFPKKVKTVTSYQAYSFLSLIAEIGGYVGLFMDVSFLDIINLVDFLEISKGAIQTHLFRH